MSYPKIHSFFVCILAVTLCTSAYTQAHELSPQEPVDINFLEEGEYQLSIPSLKYNQYELTLEEKRTYKSQQLMDEDVVVELDNGILLRIMSKTKEDEGIKWIKYALKE